MELCSELRISASHEYSSATVFFGPCNNSGKPQRRPRFDDLPNQGKSKADRHSRNTTRTASGQLCLVDGATFSIGPTWVRLDSLKAPSMGRFCSRDTSKPNCKFAAMSVDALADLLVNGVACTAMKSESRGRWLSTCKLPDGRDLGTEIVRLGFACAATAISSRYAEVETQARMHRRGLWAPQSGYDLASDCALKNRGRDGHC